MIRVAGSRAVLAAHIHEFGNHLLHHHPNRLHTVRIIRAVRRPDLVRWEAVRPPLVHPVHLAHCIQHIQFNDL